MASVGFWLQRHGRRLVVIVPFVWLLLFFLAPFLIVLKLSFSEPVLAQPPYAPLLELAEEAGNTYLRVQLNCRNFTSVVRKRESEEERQRRRR